MRRAVGILSTATTCVFVATLAFAADPQAGGSMHEQGSTSGMRGTSDAGFVGEHTMTGKITDIDKEKGRVTVDTEGESLDLHFPKNALENLKKGDEVTVSLAIKPAAGSGKGATSGTSGMPPGHSAPAEQMEPRGTHSAPAGNEYPTRR
jgi:hypothetical protein